MTHCLPSSSVPVGASRRSSAPAPEHRWVSRGSTLNPSPGPLLKQRRDTAEGCRDRATADLREAVTMATAHSRQMLERSAASWTARADLLERIEAGVETEFNACELTASEIAEDAAHVQ